MKSSLAIDSQRIGLELHALLQDVDPARWHAEVADIAQNKLVVIHSALQSMKVSGTGALARAVEELRSHVDSTVRHPSTHDVTGRWQAFRDHAAPIYGELSHALRAYDIHLPMLRPTNYLRNIQHVGGAVLIQVLLHYVLPTQGWRMAVAGSALGFAVFLEVGRYLVPPFNRFLMSILGRIAHPHETNRVNSSSWFILSLFVLSFGDLVYGTVAVAILGAADPAAAVIGRRFGRFELVNGRTLEGTLTFWGVGTVVSALALVQWFDFALPQVIVMAASASGFAAVAELFSRRIDDNLAIPVAAAVGLWLVL
jgi:dolichol kinase